MLTINIPATATTGTALEWGGGSGVLLMAGTFDGATYTLQYSPDDGTTYYTVTEKYASSTSIALSAKGYKVFELPKGKLRLSRASGTSPSGMAASVGYVQESVRPF